MFTVSAVSRPDPPIHFVLPRQPGPSDARPRNAFGYLLGFGESMRKYYEKHDVMKEIMMARRLEGLPFDPRWFLT